MNKIPFYHIQRNIFTETMRKYISEGFYWSKNVSHETNNGIIGYFIKESK